MNEIDGGLAEGDVLSVLRQQLPPELQSINSIDDLLEYGIKGAKAERDAAILNFLTTKKLIGNIKLLKKLNDNTRAYIDIGNNVLLPARLQDKRLLVNIGYQFYLEMEPEEAEVFSREKLQLIESNIDILNRKIADQRAQAFIIAETLCNMSSLL
ncbi:hypothetical protein X943_002287 [Babesia divergens]|uniref:Prefoldin subunit alpha n=1 Tax=Babesia divergens TaxID=32595 RepID=A0AAD9GHL4_BABDI|nr:hypothetical protein X943_002287 [Babesia divergens]